MAEFTGHALFDEPYWLDAVAPGQWAAVEHRRGGILIGRLPYVVKRKYGFTSISTPLYSSWLSPWIKPSGGKARTELSHQHQVLQELEKGLPRSDRTYIAAAPEYTNLMALQWAGYRLGFGYTHRLDLKSNSEEDLWQGLRDTIRQQIKKSEKILKVTTNRTIEDFSRVLSKTFARQGMDVSGSLPALARIDGVMKKRNQCRIFSAEDGDGKIHAAVYVVFDERHAFYIAGGGDPALRQSGAHALAMWQAIRDAKGHTPTFDFLGSMIPSIELFVRGFGARQVPRFTAEKFSGFGRLARAYQALRA
jgi:hypothetical protein